VTLVFALLAAFSNALNVVTQHVASTAAPAKDRGWRLALYLVRNPLWLLGVGAMVGAFVFQALALYDGRLSVVQAILVTQLVFSLVIGRLWLRRNVGNAAWVSASVTSAGLALFLIMSEPQGGHPSPTPGAWLPVLATTGGLVVLFTILAAQGSPVRRAALYAAATGIVWAVMATFIKSATDLLATDGPVAMLEDGAVYGLIIAGIVGTVLTQAALHHGPLGVSQPVMVSVDPFVSVVLGVWLYGEHFTHSPLAVTLGVLGFAVMVVGVVFLGRTAPSFEAHAPQSSPAAP
jgi:drug/metabolite transporter (DMT)-like permease